MLFSLLYMVLRAILRLAPEGDRRDREVEILVLRHQVKVFKRKAGLWGTETPSGKLLKANGDCAQRLPALPWSEAPRGPHAPGPLWLVAHDKLGECPDQGGDACRRALYVALVLRGEGHHLIFQGGIDTNVVDAPLYVEVAHRLGRHSTARPKAVSTETPRRQHSRPTTPAQGSVAASSAIAASRASRRACTGQNLARPS
jgi:hypothetical protein